MLWICLNCLAGQLSIRIGEGMDKYIYKGMRIYFSAPSPAESIKPDFDLGPNFQWVKMALIFTDEDSNQYSYAVALKSTGTRSGTNEGVRIQKGDKWAPIPAIESSEIEGVFKNKLGNFDVVRNHERYKDAFFVNQDEHPHEDKAGPGEAHYNYIKFNSLFNNLKYELIGTTNKRLTPFGMIIGKEASMDMHNLYHEAIKTAKDKTDYFTGGFDIMKKLVKKQRETQKEQQEKLTKLAHKLAWNIIALSAITADDIYTILEGLHSIAQDEANFSDQKTMLLSTAGINKLKKISYSDSIIRDAGKGIRLEDVINKYIALFKTASMRNRDLVSAVNLMDSMIRRYPHNLKGFLTNAIQGISVLTKA